MEDCLEVIGQALHELGFYDENPDQVQVQKMETFLDLIRGSYTLVE